MNRLRLAGPILALPCLALLVVSAQAGAAKSQPNKVKKTSQPILTLAMDGPRVAYMRNGRRVAVWNVVTGKTAAIKGTYPSKGSRFGDSYHDEVAIAGRRVALITRFATGNSQETQERLYTAPLGGTARQIGKPTNHVTTPGYPGLSSGDWIGGLVGSGKVLAVSTWTSNDSVSSGERLSLITPNRLRMIVTGPGAIVAESAAGGHIAVLRSTLAWPASGVGPVTTAPSAGVYSADGTLLREITPSSAREIALSGKRLVVLTSTNTLEVYKWTTGELVHTWPVATPRQEGGDLAIYGNLAVYVVDPRFWTRRLHLLDLTTGKDVVIATVTGGGDGVIGLKGLAYSVNSLSSSHGRHPHGKLVFVPTSKLLAMLK
ncbi:MAG TPA: hypothetical protein VE088_10615 [Gaiellaceae bacterium]|nr:hypothetical protein [Gaiellaceae bacterium]